MLQNRARIEEIAGVEGALDRAHRRHFAAAVGALEPRGFRHSDPVLGADRAASAERQLEHGVVDPRILGIGAEHVDVDVSVAEMTE